MGHAETRVSTVTTGLLSEAERRFLRGESDVEDPQGYRGNLRHRARKRMEQIEDDLELLEEHGHGDIANEFRQKYEREELRNEIDELRELVEELNE